MDIEHEIAQLRHLFSILKTTDVPQPKQLADGLLGPVITRLEKKYAAYLFENKTEEARCPITQGTCDSPHICVAEMRCIDGPD